MLRASSGLNLRRLALHAAILTVLATVFLGWALAQIFPWPYIYDEADYMYVATQGAAANYLDAPSQPLPEFLRMGLTEGRDPGRRGSLSEFIRGSGDMNFYRHWHGPLYYFWLQAVATGERQKAGGEQQTTGSERGMGSEPNVRRWFVVFPLATALAIYFGALWIFAPPVDLPAAILSSVLFLWSYPVGRSNEIAPHPMYVLWYVLVLILLAKLMVTPQRVAAASGITEARRYWYAAVALTAVAFATMEIAITLVAALLIVAWRERAILRPDKPWAIRSLLLFAGVAAALWPLGVLRLNAVKSYLFMVYLALFRHNPWGDVTLAETWRLRLTGSPVEWLVFAAVLLAFRYRRDRAAFPALVYSLLTFAAMFRVNTDTPRYMLPFLAGFHVLAGFVLAERLARWRTRWRAAAVAALAVLVWANTARQVAAHPIHPDPRPQAVLDSIRENSLEGRRILVPLEDLPMLHYYYPRSILRSYTTPEPPGNSLNDSSDATLLRGYPVRWRMPPDPTR